MTTAATADAATAPTAAAPIAGNKLPGGGKKEGGDFAGKPPSSRPNPINVAYEEKMSALDLRINTAKARLVRIHARHLPFSATGSCAGPPY